MEDSQFTAGDNRAHAERAIGLHDNSDGTYAEKVYVVNTGGSATVADGADVNAGATTDAAVTADANGTLSAKLRGLVKIFGDVWDSASHVLKVSVALSKLGTPGTGVTADAAAALTAGACQSVLLSNTDAANALLFGNSVGQLTTLNKGERVSIPATDVSQIYVKDAVGDSHATFAYQPVVAA